MSQPHVSVLLNEVLKVFEGVALTTFVDGTLGAGGHAEALLKAHPEMETYFGFDRDPEALQIAKKRLNSWENKIRFIHANFSDIDTYVESCEGILLDLGVSSMQLDQPEKGFSFMYEGPLDMRMDSTQELTAKEIVNTWSEGELGRIFRDFGEEKKWRRAASRVVWARKEKPIETTEQLVSILEPVLYSKKRTIHPLTLVFQALRIAVNGELEAIEKVLPKALNMLSSKGRLAVITFHSLEDRPVKKAFRFAASDKMQTRGLGGLFLGKEPQVRLLSRKPFKASEEEVRQNPRSRSAKLRAVEKV